MRVVYYLMNCFLVIIFLVFMNFSIFRCFWLLHLKNQSYLSLLFVKDNYLLLVYYCFIWFVLCDILINFRLPDNFSSSIDGSKYAKYDISFCHFVIKSNNASFITTIKLITDIFMSNTIIIFYILNLIIDTFISNLSFYILILNPPKLIFYYECQRFRSI